MSKFLSRKFILAAVSLLVASVALFAKLLTGAEFTTIVGLVIGSFAAGDVALNYIHKDQIGAAEK